MEFVFLGEKIYFKIIRNLAEGLKNGLAASFAHLVSQSFVFWEREGLRGRRTPHPKTEGLKGGGVGGLRPHLHHLRSVALGWRARPPVGHPRTKGLAGYFPIQDLDFAHEVPADKIGDPKRTEGLAVYAPILRGLRPRSLPPQGWRSHPAEAYFVGHRRSWGYEEGAGRCPPATQGRARSLCARLNIFFLLSFLSSSLFLPYFLFLINLNI